VLQHEVVAGKEAPTLVVRSTLGGAALPDVLEGAIEARCTNRRFYRREALPPSALQSIAAAAGTSLHWLDSGAARRSALAMLRVAEAERFSQWRLHNELFDSIRFDIGWNVSTAHGLPPAALEIELPMRRPFALLRNARIARIFTAFGGAGLLAWRAAALPCALAPHLVLIATPRSGDDVADTLYAGRALQRTWLAAAQAGAAVQPFAACGALLRQTPGDGWVRTGTLQRLLRQSRRLAGQLGLVGTYDVQIFLRIGKAALPSARTGREDLGARLPAALRDPPE
jgi:hypothetical protein